MISFLHFNGLLAEYYHTLCSVYVLSARRGWQSEFLPRIFTSIVWAYMVQENRCRRIQPTQGAAASSFQLKDGGSSIVFAKSTCYQCWNIIHFTCSVIAETEVRM